MSNPLLTLYIHGCWIFPLILLFAAKKRPEQFAFLLDDEAARLQLPRRVVLTVLVIAYTVGWPFAVALVLLELRRRSR